MKICELYTGSGRLQRAATDLKERWLETREQWTDNTCRQFEEEFLVPLAPLLNQLNAALSKFSEVIEEAEKECSDPEQDSFRTL